MLLALLPHALLMFFRPFIIFFTSARGGMICERISSAIAGKILHTLIGYTSHPTGMQLVVYATTLAMIFTLMRFFGHAPAHNPVQNAVY